MNQALDFCKLGLAVIETEAVSVQALSDRIDDRFAEACRCLLGCQGRIIVTGIGKSGHIAKKIASTFASTGSPAFYVHPAEASHGDMGMITQQDVVLAISYSGYTHELISLLPLLKRKNIPMIALTGNRQSPLAEAADINIDVSVKQEACPLGLAPTASTTCALVMGDALAIALLQARGFTQDDFALSHPGGSLGKRLLLHIDDIMHSQQELPIVSYDTLLRDGLMEMTAKKFGLTTVVNSEGALLGIFTDGDLRRALDKNYDINTTRINEVMTKNCKTVKKGLLAAEALNIMETQRISALVIVDERNNPIGIINMHDLLRAGVV